MNLSDEWYKSLTESLKKGQKNGFYWKISRLRWKLLIDKVISKVDSVKCDILKTDAWNEACGNSLIDNIHPKCNIKIIDISEGIINLIRKEYPNSEVSDIQNLIFENNTIDVIVDISTSDHCPESSLRNIFEEYNRVLKDNGYLLIIHNSSQSIFWKIARLFGYHSPVYSGFPPVYYFSPKVIKSKLSKHFVIEETYCTNILSWAQLFLNKLPVTNQDLIYFLASVELKLNSKILSFLGRQYVFICKKK
jgi:SAM-dependent methyltransferase